MQTVCQLAGSLSFLDDVRLKAEIAGVPKAIIANNTSALFDWLLTSFSYQGISDKVARGFIHANGQADWASIERDFAQHPTCPLLRSYRHFAGCGYHKGSYTCSEPEHLDRCPLPGHRLRNGRLNQTAFSFFLFVRDIAGGDLVGWIDDRIASHDPSASTEPAHSLIWPLSHVYGVSNKVLEMSLSGLLLAVPHERPVWFAVGKDMVAIDTLVHNFLHRTGITAHMGRSHLYGPACYAADGCAAIMRELATHIDARQFNAAFPTYFPRFVQHAVWRYCAADGLNICNGNRIDDTESCRIGFCRLKSLCDRKPSKMLQKQWFKP